MTDTSAAGGSRVKFVDVHLDDVVQMRKPHPCGGSEWSIVRLGADIGLRCSTCQHRVLLPRSQFERQLKAFISRAAATEKTGELPAG